jgi:hypothetical protein
MFTAIRRSSSAARMTIATTLAIALLGVSGTSGFAAKAKKAGGDSTYNIREKCVAKAQAAYPDNGLGTATVMTQRTGVYADCARSNGIRP